MRRIDNKNETVTYSISLLSENTTTLERELSKMRNLLDFVIVKNGSLDFLEVTMKKDDLSSELLTIGEVFGKIQLQLNYSIIDAKHGILI